MIRLETKRKTNRRWLPILPWHKMLSWSRWDAQEHDSMSNQASDVAMHNEGHFVVTWHQFYQDSHDTDVLAQRFDRNGNPL